MTVAITVLKFETENMQLNETAKECTGGIQPSHSL